MINVLIVDDSKTTRQVMRDILASDPEVRVVGEASDGREAVDQVIRLRPDIITMDIVMPKMNGLEAISYIMAKRPTPILVVSSLADRKEVNIAFKAIKLGALEVVGTPEVETAEDFERLRKTIVEKVKLLSRIRVITHHLGRRKWEKLTLGPTGGKGAPQRRVVAVGASTGGPNAVTTLLAPLPRDFPAAILLVQHITEGFSAAFAQWLEKEIQMEVRVPEDRETIEPRRVYVAPGDLHLTVRGGRIVFSDGPALNSCKPSIDVLFSSVAETYGEEALAVLLTGMGKDGANGCKSIIDKGGRTLVQDEATSLVFGMPQAAISIGAATEVLPIQDIPERLLQLVLPRRQAPA